MQDDRHFRIFVSSTFHGLEDQRKAAIEVIVNAQHIPVALERFSAANESDLEVIKRAIAESQIYILILGHRYGEIVPGTDISYTELEYEIAEQNGLLILPFVLDAEEVNRRRHELDQTDEGDLREIANHKRLMTFRERVQHFRQIWRPDGKFGYLVQKALSDHLHECSKPGLVPEPKEPLRGLLESASRNEFIVNIVRKLSSFERLDQRCSERSGEKEALARFFQEKYTDRIIANQVSLFFESGSTVAYVARALSEPLAKVVASEHSGNPSIKVRTNNVLAYLQLWLSARIPCTLFPWGPPEETYGASFGNLANIQRVSPRYDHSPLDDTAKREIDSLLHARYTLAEMDTPGLLLGATSGLQLGDKHKIVFPKDAEKEVPEDIQQERARQISSCYGPHVGSYHNKVFKRFMYSTKIPLMIFITGDKIDSEIRAGICHFICDEEFMWEDMYRDHPLAFCVGCKQEKANEYAEMFEKLDFKIERGPDCSRFTAFLARNSAFEERFDNLLDK